MSRHNTAKHLSDEDIASAELNSQLQEFINQAKALLCGQEYFDVSDTYDNLVLAFDEVLRGKKLTYTQDVNVIDNRPSKNPSEYITVPQHLQEVKHID